MFRNAIASSSKLSSPLSHTSPASPLQISPFSSSSSRSDTPSLASVLRDLSPHLDTSSASPPSRFARPPSSIRTVPTISSLSPSRNVAPPKFRWNPAPSTDETNTTHTLTVTSTRNNLLLTLSDRQGPVFPTITGGSGKTFKNSGRSGYEAGHQASLKMFEKLLELHAEAPGFRSQGGLRVRLAMKGFGGQGAEAFTQALGGNEGGDVRKLIARVEDRTGIKIGGTRARKPRRL